MPKYEGNSKIKILNKEYVVEDILASLTILPAKEIVSFFNEIEMELPRALRISVLKEVLRPLVLETRKERAKLADEMNYRLSWFNQFTETQLVNLFEFYKNSDLEKLYFEILWLTIIEYITDNKISSKNFEKFLKIADAFLKNNPGHKNDFIKFNEEINDLFLDNKGELDGLAPNALRPVLYKSSTITEIRQLGKKYNVNVPNRLKKAELIELIVKELKERGEYSPEKEEKLKSMNILLIQRFAINNEIKASTELKKEEVIEYILLNAKQTKDLYYVPEDSVYEVEAEDLGEKMPEVEILETVIEEEVIEKPVIEEVIEEVIEKPVTEEVIEEVKVIEPKKVKVIKEVVEEETEDFDFAATIKETIINAVRFRTHKSKSNKPDFIESELPTEDLEDENENEININDLVIKRRGFSFGRFLFKFLLTIIIILLIVLVVFVVYALLTPNGTPNSLASIENAINKLFNWNIIIKIRELIAKIF